MIFFFFTKVAYTVVCSIDKWGLLDEMCVDSAEWSRCLFWNAVGLLTAVVSSGTCTVKHSESPRI